MIGYSKKDDDNSTRHGEKRETHPTMIQRLGVDKTLIKPSLTVTSQNIDSTLDGHRYERRR